MDQTLFLAYDRLRSLAIACAWVIAIFMEIERNTRLLDEREVKEVINGGRKRKRRETLEWEKRKSGKERHPIQESTPSTLR